MQNTLLETKISETLFLSLYISLQNIFLYVKCSKGNFRLKDMASQNSSINSPSTSSCIP